MVQNPLHSGGLGIALEHQLVHACLPVNNGVIFAQRRLEACNISALSGEGDEFHKIRLAGLGKLIDGATGAAQPLHLPGHEGVDGMFPVQQNAAVLGFVEGEHMESAGALHALLPQRQRGLCPHQKRAVQQHLHAAAAGIAPECHFFYPGVNLEIGSAGVDDGGVSVFS